MIMGLIALVAAASFLGAAFYVNFAEHAGRLGLQPSDAVRQWAPAYARGYIMQGGLALISGVAGTLCWWDSGNGNWASGALLMFANWPWTMLAIMPINRKLLALGSGGSSDEQAAILLNRWTDRHTIRTILALLAVISYVFALVW